MTTLLDKPNAPQHAVFTGVSWSDYDRTLEETGDRAVRIAFLDGTMEIMPPLPEHESIKKAIGDLIAVVAIDRKIPRKSFGSTTFRIKEKAAGSEADECFYFGDLGRIRGMKRFDPSVHRAPDLWVEVHLLNLSISREVICARLGVREIWRCRGNQLIVRLLTDACVYADSTSSGIFPFLPMTNFAEYVKRMVDSDETQVLIEFAQRLKSLPA